jgi:hypothetical protein
MNIIMVSDAHKMPAPLVYKLDEHSLIITSDYGAPDAFELVAPSAKKGKHPPTVIFDHEESYYLYQCLHELFQPSSEGERK